MKTQLSKEVFDFLNQFGMVMSIDDKKYIHLPHVFEVVSEPYNTVIEHYSDKKLPEHVKECLIDNAICKPVNLSKSKDVIFRKNIDGSDYYFME